MSQLKNQIDGLVESLSQYDANARVEWPVGKIANALIVQAKDAEPNNPVLAEIESFEPGHHTYIDNFTAAGVCAVMRQVSAVFPTRAPSLA